MTREEAINHIKTVAKSAIDSGYDSAVVDAVSMAKEALEQEPKYCDRNICIQNEYNGIGCGECEVTKSQEPCEDAISRQAVLEVIDVKSWEFCDYLISESRNEEQKPVSHFADNLRECISEDLPSIQPQPKTGHWIRWYEQKENDGCIERIPHCKCSECGKEYDPHSSQFMKYCNECGAKMIEPQESEANK